MFHANFRPSNHWHTGQLKHSTLCYSNFQDVFVSKLSVSLSIKPAGFANPPVQLLLNRIQMGLDEPELLHIGQKVIKGKRVLKAHGKKRWTFKVPASEQRAKLHR